MDFDATAGALLINARLFRSRLILADLGIWRGGAAELVDITGDRLDLAWFKHSPPGQHAFLRHAVDDRFQVIQVVGSVNPVAVAKVGSDQPAAVSPVARGAQGGVGLRTLGEN